MKEALVWLRVKVYPEKVTRCATCDFYGVWYENRIGTISDTAFCFYSILISRYEKMVHLPYFFEFV